ncbi:BQ2448_1774 [Microbotryum intermedium]|uniref:BQ2448_1774 protein n=1 Tax=Microbotryum intermedium TaxID=269621 RepID=A0A238F962_9BASI|nr:BQ2448_1774 [Microbotryum intermedium]
MVAGIDGFGWFGLVVYLSVMGFVNKGVRVPIPLGISRPLLKLAVLLRLRDPMKPQPHRLPRPGSKSKSETPLRPAPSSNDSLDTPTPSGSTKPMVTERLSTRPSLRSRSESKIGVNASAPEEEFSDPGHKSADSTADHDGSQLGHSKNKEERWSFPIDLRTAPVAGVVLLLITTTIEGSVLRKGIVGEEGVRPYDVLVLFISLAYISTALDSTGGLRALAFFISQKSARTPKMSPPSAEKTASGVQLYTTLYAFWFVAGVIVGNDPIVLSGTAFLGYMTRVTGITTPTAWTFSQFIAANVASAALVSSNPTNVLIAGAFELNFLTGYTKNTLLPSVITQVEYISSTAAVVAYPLLLVTFKTLKPPRKDGTAGAQAYIPAQLTPPDANPRSALLDPKGAIFHSVLMLLTLAVLVGTSFVKSVEVWMVTAPGGIIALLRDLWSERGAHPASTAQEPKGIDLGRINEPTSRYRARYSLPAIIRAFKRQFPTTATTISRLPLSLLPFAGGIFILARALTSLGWTSIFASWLAKISVNPAATIFFLGYFIALALCPLCGTNIGATILLVEILRDPNFSQAPHALANPKILTGAIFSTAMASNLGAFSWTFSSSLAGLLWVSILRQKGIHVEAREFAAWNCLFLPVLSTVASAIVLLEVEYFQ